MRIGLARLNLGALWGTGTTAAPTCMPLNGALDSIAPR
jgi:hypothetical protein